MGRILGTAMSYLQGLARAHSVQLFQRPMDVGNLVVVF